MTSLRAVSLLVFAFCGWVPPAFAATFLAIFTQPGDTSLNGLNGRFETTATVRLTGDLEKRELYAIGIQVANVTSLDFYPPPGMAFALGHYPRAQASGTLGHPGMRIGQCIGSFIDGQFTILEAEVAADGTLISLAIDFEQHCNLSYASVYGGIRINSDIPYSAPPPPPPPPIRMTLAGEPGEPVSQGTTRTFDDASTALRVQGVQGTGRVNLMYALPGVPWTFEVSGLAGAAVVPGTYEMGPASPPNSPRFAAGLSGITCPDTNGRFVVHEAEHDDYRYTKLAVDFEQRCGGSLPTLLGQLRINSSVAYATPTFPVPAAVSVLQPAANFDIVEQTTITLQAAALDSAGARVPNVLLQLGTAGECGTASPIVRADASGVATFSWTAPPASNATILCAIRVRSYPNGPAEAVFSAHVTPAPPATVQSLAYTSSPREYSLIVPRDPVLRNIVVRTLQASGAALGGQRVRASASCGRFNSEFTAEVFSDSSGVATLPDWTPPSTPGDCVIDVSLPANTSAAHLSFTVHVTVPAAIHIEYLDDRRVFIADDRSRSVTGLRAATVGANGVRVPNQTIEAHASCGSFPGEVRDLLISSDSSGIVSLPDWRAPPAPAPDCTLTLIGVGGVGTAVTFTLRADVPPPPVGPSASGASPYGGMVTLSLPNASGACTLTFAQFLDSQTMNMSNGTPMRLQMPHLVLDSYVFAGAKDCGSTVTLTIEFPRPLPPTAQWWNYGATASNLSPHWYTTPVTVGGSKITFTIEDGGDGDGDRTKDGKVSLQGAMAIPGGTYQDLWWAGAIENGWGMSIVQHRDVLFANVFVYDAQGRPVWYVMPSGSWNAAKTTYTGSLYLPKGSPFYAYDVSRFDVGPAIGTASLAFSGANEATFDYTIGGVTGRKAISRIAFGPRDSWSGQPFSDLWWGGTAQNGWGVALLQQYGTIFGLWYTYDASGAATWFVMPGGTWTRSNEWSGKTYRPEGSAWLGAPYDASRHRTVENGAFTFRFSSDEAASFDYTVDGLTRSVPITRIPF